MSACYHTLSSDDNSANIDAAPSWSKRCLLVELENEDPLRAKSLRIFGKIKRKLSTALFDLSRLTSVSTNSILNVHRMEGRRTHYQGTPEDASLPEQAAEDRVSEALIVGISPDDCNFLICCVAGFHRLV